MSTHFNKISIVSLSTALILAVSGCGGGGGDAPVAAAAAALNGSAGLSGTLGNAGGGGANPAPGRVGARLAPTNTIDPDASAQLIVDLNKNGTFGDSKDIAYTSQVVNGSFSFSGIKIAEEGVTEAQLTVLKRGFAPVVKVVTLSNGQTLSIRTEAGTVPLQTEVVALDRNNSNLSLKGAFLKMGLKTTTFGIQSYSKIMSLSQLRAEAATPEYGNGEISTSVIPLDAVPDSVTEIRADMKAFDPTSAEDSKFFPGEYKGVGKPSGAKATNEERQLVSVGFDLISLTDQNGEAIELDASAIKASKLRPQAIDFASCLQTKVRYLSAAQVTLIENMGDDDNNTPNIFEIPMWYYDNQSGMWKYLGEAEYTNLATSTRGSAYATMCITENWGQYLNLDYDFAIEQPKNVCVKATDQNGVAVGNLSIDVKKDTSYTHAYLDSEGKANLGLTLGSNPSDYEFAYSGALTRWARVNVDSSNIVAGQTDLCDYNLSIVIQNPYTTTLKVTAKEINGDLSSRGSVTVSNDGGDYFYEYSYLDENGTATFKIAPNVDYTVRYNSTRAAVNANGTKIAPETLDSGSLVKVTIKDVNSAPDVYAYFNNPYLSERATQVGFYVSATDRNEDTITFDSLTLNGTPLVEGTHYEITRSYIGNDYNRFNAILDLTHPDVAGITGLTATSLSAGAYSLVATYSDADVSSAASADLSVVANQKPVINGIYLHSPTRSFINVRSEILAGVYTVSANAYDPNGDDINVTYKLDDGDFTVLAEVNLVDGEHNITVRATEVGADTPLSVQKVYRIVVGSRSPTIAPFTADVDDTNTINGNLIATSPNPVSVSIVGATPAGLTLYFTGAYTFDGKAHRDLAAGVTRDVVANVSVTNSYGTAQTTFTVTVTGTNDAPTLTVPMSVVSSATGVSIPYSAADVDSEVTVTATAGDGAVVVSDVNLTYTPNDSVTSDTITVVASDGDLNVTKTISVLFGNQPPSFQDQQEFFVEGGASISGTVSFSDDNVSSPATIAVNGTPPAGFVLNSDGTFTYSAAAFAELTLGTQRFLEIGVTLTDSEGLTTSGMVFIMVNGVYEFFAEGGFTQGMSIYGIEKEGEMNTIKAWRTTLDTSGAITETKWYLDKNTGEFVVDSGSGGGDDDDLYLINGTWSQNWNDNTYTLVNGNVKLGNGVMVKILRTIDLTNPTAIDAAAIAALSAEIPGNPTVAFSAGAEAYVTGFRTPEMYVLTYKPTLQVQDATKAGWTKTTTPFSTILNYMGSVNSPAGKYSATGEWSGVDFQRDTTSGNAAYFHAYPVVDSTGASISSLVSGMSGNLVSVNHSALTQAAVGTWSVVTLPDGELALEIAPTSGNEAIFAQYANLIAVANGIVYQGAHRAASTEFVVDTEDNAGLNSVAFNDIKNALSAYVTGASGANTLSALLAGKTLWAQIDGKSATLESQVFNAAGTGVTWTEIVNPGSNLCTGTVSIVFEANATVTVQGVTDSCGLDNPNNPFNVSVQANKTWNYILVSGDKWYFSESDARADFLGETVVSASDAALVSLFVGKTVYYIETAADGSTSGASITFDAGTVSAAGVYSGYSGGIDGNGGYGIQDTPPNQTHSYVIDGKTLRVTEAKSATDDGEVSDVKVGNSFPNNGIGLVVIVWNLGHTIYKDTKSMVVYPTAADRDAAMSSFDAVTYFSGTKYFVNANGFKGYRTYDAGDFSYIGEFKGTTISGAFIVSLDKPNEMQIINNFGTAQQEILLFTYSGTLPSNGVTFNLKIKDVTFETYMYDTVAARDAKATSLGF